jgi:hypothetical protein
MCNSLSPIARRHHHLDLHFYGLVIVTERMKGQYTIQLNTRSAPRSVYIHTVIVKSKIVTENKTNITLERHRHELF